MDAKWYRKIPFLARGPIKIVEIKARDEVE
jgi:hypothetical protein